MTKMLGIMVYCRIIVLLNFNLDDTLFYNPWFVKTPMTDMNRFKMPMIMSPQDAADKIIAGLNSNRFEIYFPTLFVLIMKFLRILPYKIKLFLTQKILK
jgi:hypothetical protein